MRFEDINSYLADKALQLPSLNILEQDNRTYTAALFQPEGVPSATEGSIKNDNPELAIKKFNAFIDHIQTNQPDIAVTPEYSCPWATIERLVTNNLFPSERSLWVLGCESIQPAELKELTCKLPNVTWVFEDIQVQNPQAKPMFFDPLCYVFQALNTAGHLQTVVLIQFKTQNAGGDYSEYEANLIQGNRIYILRNRTESARLVSLICSDALSNHCSVEQIPNISYIPHMIIHIQHTKNPIHSDFRKFRMNTYGTSGGENKEFIALNWAMAAQSRGYSSIHIKTNTGSGSKEKIELSDTTITHNHRRGLYYTYFKHRYSNIFYLNPQEHIFEYVSTKISIAGQAIVLPQNRSGPQMSRIMSWDPDFEAWEQAQPDDGFNSVLKTLTVELQAYLKPLHVSPTNIERLAAISTGKATSKEWHKPINLVFFQTEENELPQRITFAPENYYLRDNLRRKTMLQLERLAAIIHGNTELPRQILTEAGYKLDYHSNSGSDAYLYNVYPITANGNPATIIYLGESTQEFAKNVLDRVSDLFEGQNFRRIVVFYTDTSNKLQNEADFSKPTITDSKESQRSFSRAYE